MSKEVKRSLGARILSILCLVILAVLIIGTLVTGIMGSKYFMGFLVLMIIVTFMMYIILWLRRVLGGNEQDK